ncbi:MAG: TerC family protein [Nitratireductor sp.]
MTMLATEVMGTAVWLWIGFLVLIIGLMAFDLGILHRDSRLITARESLKLASFYVSLAFLFGIFLYFYKGADTAFLFLTGYVVEQSLSLDNIFVIAVILSYFAIPREFQHRVLFYGILGVIVLRGVMILAGAAVLNQFHWILYFFAAFLIITGIKMLMSDDDDYNVEKNWVLKFLRRHFRITEKLHGDRFAVRETDPRTGRIHWHVTPLLLALCVIEVADVVFAVDSIPAIFAITTDPFIVFTSNIFAVLGLRSMFFALSALIHRFRYLKFSLSVVLVFIGAKILLADFAGIDISDGLSLAITLGLLVGGVVVSMLRTEGEPPEVIGVDDDFRSDFDAPAYLARENGPSTNRRTDSNT